MHKNHIESELSMSLSTRMIITKHKTQNTTSSKHQWCSSSDCFRDLGREVPSVKCTETPLHDCIDPYYVKGNGDRQDHACPTGY